MITRYLIALLTPLALLASSLASAAADTRIDYRLAFERQQPDRDIGALRGKDFSKPRPRDFNSYLEYGSRDLVSGAALSGSPSQQFPIWYSHDRIAFTAISPDDTDLTACIERSEGDSSFDLVRRFNLFSSEPDGAGTSLVGPLDAAPALIKERSVSGQTVGYEGRRYAVDNTGAMAYVKVVRDGGYWHDARQFPSGRGPCVVGYKIALRGMGSDFDGDLIDLTDEAGNRHWQFGEGGAPRYLELLEGRHGGRHLLLYTTSEGDLKLLSIRYNDDSSVGTVGTHGSIKTLIPNQTAEIITPTVSVNNGYLAFTAKVREADRPRGFTNTHSDYEIYVAKLTVSASGGLTLGPAIRQTVDPGSDIGPAFTRDFINLDGTAVDGPDWNDDSQDDTLLAFSHRPLAGSSNSQQTSTGTANYDLCLLTPKLSGSGPRSGQSCPDQLTSDSADDLYPSFDPSSTVHTRDPTEEPEPSEEEDESTEPQPYDGGSLQIFAPPVASLPQPDSPTPPAYVANITQHEDTFKCKKVKPLRRKIRAYKRDIRAVRRQAKSVTSGEQWRRLLRRYRKAQRLLAKRRQELSVCNSINGLYPQK